MRLFCVLMFLMSFATNNLAQNDCGEFTSFHKKVLQSILIIDSEVPSKLEELRTIYPNNYVNAYLEHYFEFVQFLTFEDSVHYFTFTKNSNDKLDQLREITPHALLLDIQANIYFHLGVVEAIKGNRWKAIMSFFDGYRLVKEARNIYGLSLDQQKFEAVFLIVFDQFPKEVEWLKQFLRLNSDAQEGFRKLNAYKQNVAQDDGWYEEALLYQAMLHLKFSPDSAQLYSRLVDEESFSKSPLLLYVGGFLALKERREIDEFLYQEGSDRFPLLNYIHGRHKLNQFDESCITEFDVFLKSYKGDSYKVDALMRKCWWYYVKGSLKQIEEIQTLVKEMPTPTKIDKHALSEIANLKNYHPQLLKSRILFDGGNYKSALSCLVHDTLVIDFHSNQLEEYYYRLGRIYHLMDEKELALINYQLAIDYGLDSKRYFAPKSALEMANLFYLMGDFEKALELISVCDKLNNGEYESAIGREIEKLQQNF